ncbi:ligase [Clostridium sp. MSJ-4]|uniref:Ligase n=1 Tax=Clostridium simiarum TaxID=2841506 RepID=A0ABS6F3V1_9CLOT|nr:Mur ligase family protein [Clostridium simiarum]MBU5593175.1 ligase [Clostridium simiarum]
MTLKNRRVFEEKGNKSIFIKGNKIIKEDHLYNVKEQCELEGIPVIESEDNSLIIGYGKNSIFLDENIFKCKYSGDIDKILSEFSGKDKGFIPIISVTGTNGKTTTVRLIHCILTRLGYVSGLASTGGIFIGDNKIKSGDTTGYYSARMVLSNEDVQVAVLETARGGIIKRGLGYKKASVAVFTSISEDHIGMQGINHINDLIKIKTSIFDELDPKGKIVCFNSPLLLDSIKHRKRVCLFGIDFDVNMKSHMDRGQEGMFLKNNHIIYFNKNEVRSIADVRDIPFTHNGFSKSNVKNLMAAIAAVMEVHDELDDIIDILKSIKCDLYNNPGRQNILNIGEFNLLLDYGHNSEAFTEVFTIVKSFNPKNITAIIGAPGDRQNKYIRELGYIATKFSDSIIIREQEDLRGRIKGEAARLLMEGVMENKDFDISKVKVIYKEEDALLYALKSARAGEFIILFTQCLEVVIPKVEEFSSIKG